MTGGRVVDPTTKPIHGPDRWCPKYLREVLCIQQTYAPDPLTVQMIDDLVKQLDFHRPRGVDGKHGSRHTPTCGCEDQ